MEATPICQAWLRPDGGKGIRNKVLVLYTVECSKHVAESIAAHFQAQHRDVDVTGSLACLDNQAVVQRMLAYCVHPNVGAVLIVGHGCEYIEPDRIRDFARAHGRPAEAFYLQKVGGTPVAPILKLTGNQETFDMLSHDIDFCAGSVLTGAETKAEAAERLWSLIQRICNGEEVHAERVGHRQGTLFFNYQDPRRVVPCRY